MDQVHKDVTQMIYTQAELQVRELRAKLREAEAKIDQLEEQQRQLLWRGGNLDWWVRAHMRANNPYMRMQAGSLSKEWNEIAKPLKEAVEA